MTSSSSALLYSRLLLSLLLLMPSLVFAQSPKGPLRYRGFVVETAAIDSAAGRDSVLAGVRLQLDMVDELKLADSIRAFLHAVPLVMTIDRVSGSALYRGDRVIIPLFSVVPYDREHPVVLHEFCHAIHEKLLPGGYGNAEVLALFEAAKASGRFPGGSYMLSDVTEYFAMMASVYLHGSAARDPFTRRAIEEKQPAMYAMLVRTFGPM